MSDNPLETTPEREAQVKARARQLWEADGRPPGREDDYTERADELIRTVRNEGYMFTADVERR